jgi:hypothetical protein
MSSRTRTWTKPIAVAAMAVGVAAGSYGVAYAASGSGSGTTTTPSPPAGAPSSAPPGATSQNPWGSRRSDETLLTGDTLAKVKAAALAKVGSDATIVRIETDADGHAAYEAHMLKSDGTPVTAYVDTSYTVVGVESR